MATLGELKTRVYQELNSRTDLEPGVGALSDALTRAIERAIEFYADEGFWFTSFVTTQNTTASQDYIELPSGLRRAETITIPSLGYQLVEISIGELTRKQAFSNSSSSPDFWAEHDEQIKLYPTPDSVYSLTITGVEDIGVPANDSSENNWTTRAQDLIAARARMILYRDQFRDQEGAGVAALAEREALEEIRRNTAQRLKRKLKTNLPGHKGAFDINSGLHL